MWQDMEPDFCAYLVTFEALEKMKKRDSEGIGRTLPRVTQVTHPWKLGQCRVHCMSSLARNTRGINDENLRLETFQIFKLCHLPKKALSLNHPYACFMICRNTISEHLVLERR